MVQDILQFASQLRSISELANLFGMVNKREFFYPDNLVTSRGLITLESFLPASYKKIENLKFKISTN